MVMKRSAFLLALNFVCTFWQNWSKNLTETKKCDQWADSRIAYQNVCSIKDSAIFIAISPPHINFNKTQAQMQKSFPPKNLYKSSIFIQKKSKCWFSFQLRRWRPKYQTLHCWNWVQIDKAHSEMFVTTLNRRLWCFSDRKCPGSNISLDRQAFRHYKISSCLRGMDIYGELEELSREPSRESFWWKHWLQSCP